ncbi:bifunctional DNA primase/polymerase [Bradyrhizobium sp. LTSP885]|uniref:bifunctional DNA primase/polymerase n=1 Tax=Bradyrhizobium sp. LTSP885 TaxID=1619232 RepID=UPI000699CCEA|nr:bifunctional DNA primase/polymerase [Bradyrhizobium sp. LTSP885]
MIEIKNPASGGTLDGADSEIAGRDDGIGNTASTANQSANPYTETRKRLCAAGFMPIPVMGKKPAIDKWQTKTETNDGELDIWANMYPGATGTGMLTRYLPTLDIDIKNPEAAEAVEQLVRDHFEDAGVVLVRFGNKPKRAIPFRTATPYKKITVNLIAPDKSVDQKIELLADGQQVVAFGIHPDTKQPYVWFGGEPGAIRREELPALNDVQAQQLVDDAAELLVREHGYTRAKSRPKAKASPEDDNTFSNGAPDGGADWGFLTDNIHAGRDLHDSLRDLAAKLVRSGMSAGAAVNFLYGLMDSSTGPHDVRWAERRHDIPRLVDGAEELVAPQPPPVVEPRNLAEVHEVFVRWLGKDYEVATLDAMLATVAAERMKGDPAWLLIISGPGNAKTETVQALSMLGAHVVSTITSDAALLSASPAKQKAKDATGGLLRKIGDRGILAIKDVTSILSMDRNVRGATLAALREVHDGSWTRNVGTDGGKTLTWVGRIVVVGACTTAWDQAHSVISTMGDRFVLVRSDSNLGRVTGGRRAMQNTGVEAAMREEMAKAVAGVINAVDPTNVYMLTDCDENIIVEAANIVTLARTGVESDYRGDVIDSHAPEMPTRFAKQLCQIMRGAIAIGMTKDDALLLVIRCARDSMPQIRLAVLRDVANHPEAKVIDVRRRLQKPRATMDRTLQALHILGLLTLEEEEAERGGKTVQIKKYSLATGVNLGALD